MTAFIQQFLVLLVFKCHLLTVIRNNRLWLFVLSHYLAPLTKIVPHLDWDCSVTKQHMNISLHISLLAALCYPPCHCSPLSWCYVHLSAFPFIVQPVSLLMVVFVAYKIHQTVCCSMVFCSPRMASGHFSQLTDLQKKTIFFIIDHNSCPGLHVSIKHLTTDHSLGLFFL